MIEAGLWIESHDHFFQAIKKSSDHFFKTFYQMLRLINENETSQKSIDRLVIEIEKVDFKNKSDDLILLFIDHWISFDLSANRINESMILLKRTDAYNTNNTPGEIKGLTHICHGLVSSHLERPFESEEYYFKKALDCIKPDSRLFLNYTYQLMFYYANRGKLKKMPKKNFPDKDIVDGFIFVNAFEIGDFEMMMSYFPKVEKIKLAPHFLKIVIEEAKMFYRLFVDQKPVVSDSYWLLSFQFLLKGMNQESLSMANKIYEDEINFLLRPTSFSTYSSIRAQLACGNAHAVIVLLNIKSRLKKEGYLDAFFYARAEYLLGNKEKSFTLFALAYNSCKEYGAMGRFDLELELANEIKASDLRKIIECALGKKKNTKTSIREKTSSKEITATEMIIGNSASTKKLKETIQSYAPLDIPVLIIGETGVGKDVTARAIHESSHRSTEPFLAINCGAISTSLLQSELFGHVKGAFTGADKAHKGFFQSAGKGTIFLDEIGEISSAIQVALLRVLETNEYRPVGSSTTKPYACRIIAATNAPLEELVEKGSFRKDLLFRLKRFVISIPPLRERRDDIVPLTRSFFNLGYDDERAVDCNDSLWQALLSYEWPGNVRELKNEIEKMRILNSHKEIYALSDANFLPEKSSQRKESAGPSESETTLQGSSDRGLLDSAQQVLHKSTSKYRRMEKIRSLFKDHQRLSRVEICQILGVASQTIGNDFKDLIAENFLIKKEPTKSPRTHYFILNPDEN